jgi:hypothetical protein
MPMAASGSRTRHVAPKETSKMMHLKKSALALGFAVAATAITATVTEYASAKGRGDGPVIYVTSHGLFYDSIVTADPLPPHGPFQLLEMAGPTGLQTEFGPGDRGHVGGRWWVDLNGDGMMDLDDAYFGCPLLPPGREQP